MVWVRLKNGEGQVVKGIKLLSPLGQQYEVLGNKRLGINRYAIKIKNLDTGEIKETRNVDIRSTQKRPGWSIIGQWHTPQYLAAMFNRPLDPEANRPRHLRTSFWKMRSKPGTHNYKQKIKLMQDPAYQRLFGHLFERTIIN